MKRNRRSLALVAVTVCAIAPATANARLDLNPPTQHSAGITCGKDYSKNSALIGGKARPVMAAEHGPRCIATDAVAASTVAAKTRGFSWGSAAAGAGTAFVLVLAAAGLVIASRRRHQPTSVGPRRSPATT